MDDSLLQTSQTSSCKLSHLVAGTYSGAERTVGLWLVWSFVNRIPVTTASPALPARVEMVPISGMPAIARITLQEKAPTAFIFPSLENKLD